MRPLPRPPAPVAKMRVPPLPLPHQTSIPVLPLRENRYSRGKLEAKRLQRHYSDESLPGASLFSSPAHHRIHSSADEISSVNRSPSLSSSDESFSRTTDASHSPPRENAKDWVHPSGVQVNPCSSPEGSPRASHDYIPPRQQNTSPLK